MSGNMFFEFIEDGALAKYDALVGTLEGIRPDGSPFDVLPSMLAFVDKVARISEADFEAKRAKIAIKTESQAQSNIDNCQTNSLFPRPWKSQQAQALFQAAIAYAEQVASSHDQEKK